MKPVLFFQILLVALLCWTIYKVPALYIYAKLKTKLRKGDFYTFINTLGDDYTYRFLKGSVRRYKWRKGPVVIKATFDEADRLFCKAIRPFSFFSLYTEIDFY